MSTAPGMPAQTAGLQPGDIILSTNNQPIVRESVIKEVLSDLSNEDIVYLRVLRPIQHYINPQGVPITPTHANLIFQVKPKPGPCPNP